MVLLEYTPGTTLFHRLDVRAKLIWLITVVSLSFIFRSLLGVCIVFSWVILCILEAKIPTHKLSMHFKILTLPIIIILLYEALMYHGKSILLALPFGFTITLEGITKGLIFTLRLLIMVLASTIFTYTTPYTHILLFLIKVRTPYPIVFMLLISLRFIPSLQRELSMILDAQRARGLELEGAKSIKQLVRVYIPIMIPLLVNGVKRSRELAMAIVARGFSPKSKWVPLEEIKFKRVDYVFSFTLLALLCVVVWFRILGFTI